MSVSVAGLAAGNLFIPIFYKMKLVSVYEVSAIALVMFFDIADITVSVIKHDRLKMTRDIRFNLCICVELNLP